MAPRCVVFGRSELVLGYHEGVSCECGINYSAIRYLYSNQYQLLPTAKKRKSRDAPFFPLDRTTVFAGSTKALNGHGRKRLKSNASEI